MLNKIEILKSLIYQGTKIKKYLNDQRKWAEMIIEMCNIFDETFYLDTEEWLTLNDIQEETKRILEKEINFVDINGGEKYYIESNIWTEHKYFVKELKGDKNE